MTIDLLHDTYNVPIELVRFKKGKFDLNEGLTFSIFEKYFVYLTHRWWKNIYNISILQKTEERDSI